MQKTSIEDFNFPKFRDGFSLDGFHGDMDDSSTRKDSFGHISELENADILVGASYCVMLANIDGLSMKSLLTQQTRNLSLVSAGLVAELVERNSDIDREPIMDIDGRPVSVDVIDILPRCLSSKYLFWDPDLALLSLGKYSALQEIGWIKENQAHCPSLQYYYLGYYIHSCSKMRYKAAYRPSELLCPLRYQWVPFEYCQAFT